MIVEPIGKVNDAQFHDRVGGGGADGHDQRDRAQHHRAGFWDLRDRGEGHLEAQAARLTAAGATQTQQSAAGSRLSVERVSGFPLHHLTPPSIRAPTPTTTPAPWKVLR